MRASVDGNRAVPPLALPRVIEHRDGSGRLHNAPVAAYDSGGEVRHVRGQATHAQPVILDLIRAIDAVDRVVLELVKSSFRRHRGVGSALAAPPFVLARLG